MGVGLGGGDCLSPAPASSISAIFRLNDSFSSADIFWYAISTSLFFRASKRPSNLVMTKLPTSLLEMSAEVVPKLLALC